MDTDNRGKYTFPVGLSERCVICGVTFFLYKTPSFEKRGKNYFCSSECGKCYKFNENTEYTLLQKNNTSK